MQIKTVTVFAGASPGARAEYQRGARELGRELGTRGIRLVYGGASVGLMGIVADAVLEAGGQVTGVIPELLFTKELAHPGLTELRVVTSMHARKAVMAELADAFVALPGGFGTLEEFMEIATWGQLAIHDKPCGLLDVIGFYAPLLRFLDHAAEEQFVQPRHRAMILASDNVTDLLAALDRHRPPGVPKWVDADRT